MAFKKVVVVGGGVLGSQIAFQTAFCGLEVNILLRSEDSIKRSQPKIDRLRNVYLTNLENMENKTEPYYNGITHEKELTHEQFNELKERVEKAYKELKLTTSYEEACKGADLIIESIAEIPPQKKELFQKLAKYMEPDTIITTNSSQLVPSLFAEDTGRPEKFLALHFANDIWRNNIAEIMGHAGTDKKYFEMVVEFAEQINICPIRVLKEQRGYVLNSLLTPLLDAAKNLWAADIADPETIDKAWKLGTGAPVGPFTILDIIGLNTLYNVKMMSPNAKNPEHIDYKVAQKFKEMIDQGKLGVISGEGFYKYK
ncbi:hypothetical protein PIROE2DRAFT_53118 [Piromyces sp. E2]|nr:hypothetical protein PIROE2DRAFT_53118 [Piromyces sp. E2]|eukprot:OUM68831.1 hypothetical protein PIROE2DRAFT_53118 [Piromyces sp. E2]